MNEKVYTGLKPPKTADELIEMYYLQARCHLLETAAILDRIQRADGGRKAFKDPRMARLQEIFELLKTADTNRAEQLLNLLSV